MLDRIVLLSLFLFPFVVQCDPIKVNIPSVPASNYSVQSNFLGISFELSFVNEYFGNDTSTVPSTVINYLSALRLRTGSAPLRVRIGGNSLDDSTYVPSQTTPMIQLLKAASFADDQPVTYGPVLWDVLNQVSSNIGGASYLIGLSLRNPSDPNVPLAAGDAAKTLTSSLDGFLLGNEPDLYTSHGNRPNIQNYTTAIYFDEFGGVLSRLTNTSGGNIIDLHNIGGPTVCCRWNLDALIDDGYTAKFSNALKYISLQHYPQNNCFGSYRYQNDWYNQHPNVVSLATWQNSGVKKAVAIPGLEVILSEFNSASCGGIPTISDTFAVGSLWTVDYALQLASVGFSAAYLHTRERGISYNLFTPPQESNALASWTTNPPFYGLLVTAEALRSKNGSIVTDLNINNSMQNTSSTVSGYAVYDASDKTVQQLVFFNFANVSSSANSSTSFDIPENTFTEISGKSVTVKYLTGNSMVEGSKIAWGGQTFAGVGDGKLIASNATWAPANVQIDCTSGCTINVPAPGMAVVFASQPPSPSNSTGSTNSHSDSTPTDNTQSSALLRFDRTSLFVASLLTVFSGIVLSTGLF